MKYVKIGSGAYQLTNECSIQTRIIGYEVNGPETGSLFSLTKDGLFTLHKFFAWDGPTGAANTRDFIMGSAYHDAGCEAIRNGLLPVDLQPMFDQLMDEINRTPQVWTDGRTTKEVFMEPLRRIYSYIAVRVYQYLNAEKHHRKTVYEIKFKEA